MGGRPFEPVNQAVYEVPEVGLEPTRDLLPLDFESSSQIPEPQTDKAHTETGRGIVPSGVPFSLPDDPELVRIISAWPSLSEADRKAVLRIVRRAAGKASGESGNVAAVD